MLFSEEPLTLSNAQLSALLPLLPALAKYSSLPMAEIPATSSSNEIESTWERYTNTEMLEKKKNEHSTRAQTYLLVSSNYIIRELWFVLLQRYVCDKTAFPS